MISASELPPELEIEYYRSFFPGLVGVPDAAVYRHYQKHGIELGYPGTEFALRRNFLGLVKGFDSILEIGPYNKPVVTGNGVRYFDILDKAGLDRLAASTNRAYKGPAPYIDFVSPKGDLSVVNDSFGAVVSSHCIEHQPDLVRHLTDVGAILHRGGCYFVLSPDKRYCFDHFIPESDIAAVLEAHYQKRKVHSLESIVRQRTMTTHNVALRHWNGDHGGIAASDQRVRSAVNQYEAANGEYIDVHAWRFTPRSFREIASILYDLGLSPLKPVRVYNTPKPLFEFAAVLMRI